MADHVTLSLGSKDPLIKVFWCPVLLFLFDKRNGSQRAREIGWLAGRQMGEMPADGQKSDMAKDLQRASSVLYCIAMLLASSFIEQ